MGLLDLVGIFGGAVGGALLNIGKIISTVVNGVLALIGQLQRILSTVVNAVLGALRGVWREAESIFDNLFKKWIPRLIAYFDRIEARIHQFLKPLINQIKIIRAQQQLVFQLYIKPLLNLLSRVRQSLILLRLFHLKFAAQLDQDLTVIEGKINQAFLKQLQITNQILGYINILLDPLGNLQWGPYIRTTLQGIGALKAALWSVSNNPLGAQDAAAQDASAHFFDAKNVDNFARLIVTGGLPPDTQSQIDAFIQAHVEMGYPPPPV